MKAAQLAGLSIVEMSGVDHPANKSQMGGEGWAVIKAATKESTVSEPTLEQKLTKATEDLEAANARIAELEAAAAAATPAGEVEGGSPEAELEKALDAVPEVVKVALAKAQADADAAKADAATAAAIAKAELNRRVDLEYVAKAEAFTALPVNPAEFGPVLRALTENASAEHRDELFRVLAAADALAKSDGKALRSVGSGHGPVAKADDAMAEIRKAADELRKTETGLTHEQAVDRITDTRPDLVELYRSAMNA